MRLVKKHARGKGEDTVVPERRTSPGDEFTIVVTECPRCDRSQSVRVRNTVDAVAEPELKQQLLARTMMAHECSGCGHSYQITYDFLYLDSSQNLAIELSASAIPRSMGELAPSVPGQRRRVVTSWSDLVEKILVFDAGLDDRVVELVKLGVSRQLIARYSSALAKVAAKPLDLSRLSFRSIDHSETTGDRIEFVVPSSPRWLPITVLAPLAAFSGSAESRVAQLAAEQGPPSPIDWLVIDPAWAIGVVGGLENVPAVHDEMQVLFDPARTTHTGAVAFAEALPTVFPGTRRLIWIAKAKSRAWRPQHHYFAHHHLRVAFNAPEQWVSALSSPNRYEVIERMWDEVTRLCRSDEKPVTLHADGIKVHDVSINQSPAVIIEMTPPTGYGEVFFVALVLRRNESRTGDSINRTSKLAYYTLELGRRRDESPCTYLCEWKADGTRSNHGLGPAPILDDFVEAVTAHEANANSVVRADAAEAGETVNRMTA